MITGLLVVAFSLGLVSSALAQVTINGAGATFPQPLYNKWFYDFNAQTKIKVNYQGIGSGGGIKAIKSNTVAFAGSDAPLTDADLKTMPGTVLQIPTVGGAVAVAYNLQGLNKQLRLSPATLSGIFLGQIKNWNDPKLAAENPGANLPNRAITVVRRSDGSGTTHIFTTYMAAISPTWKTQVGAGKDVKWPVGEGGKGNPGVAGLIRNIPGAIGYCELSYATTNKLPVAQLKNRAGRYITPSLASTTACIRGSLRLLQKDIRADIVNPAGAEAYPIAGLTFIFVYAEQKDAATRDALVRLLNWCMTPTAQKSASALQYAPLPAELIAINKGLIAKIK
jgi:phosphate transport system substrate-binding protein